MKNKTAPNVCGVFTFAFLYEFYFTHIYLIKFMDEPLMQRYMWVRLCDEFRPLLFELQFDMYIYLNGYKSAVDHFCYANDVVFYLQIVFFDGCLTDWRIIAASDES